MQQGMYVARCFPVLWCLKPNCWPLNSDDRLTSASLLTHYNNTNELCKVRNRAHLLVKRLANFDSFRLPSNKKTLILCGKIPSGGTVPAMQKTFWETGVVYGASPLFNYLNVLYWEERNLHFSRLAHILIHKNKKGWLLQIAIWTCYLCPYEMNITFALRAWTCT